MTAPEKNAPAPAQREAARTTTWVCAPHVVVLRIPDPAAVPAGRTPGQLLPAA